jgi:microcystin-dependent protein
MTWSIASYSTTPGSNVLINGINIAPGCPSSSVGPAFRQLMADIATALGGGQFMPAGAIVHYPTNAAPTGYQACDATAINRIANPLLFALIGTTFGTGDGSTTFNVPDIRGRVIAGWDSGVATGRLTGVATGGVSAGTVGTAGGEQAHTLTQSELASHSHTDTGHTHVITDPGHTHLGAGGAVFIVQGGVTSLGAGGALNTSTAAATASATNGLTLGTGQAAIQATGSNSQHNTVQPTIIMLPCIKLG